MHSQILFITPNFQHGGTNKSLKCLLDLLKAHKKSISIVPINNSPGPYKKIYEKYNCIDMPWWTRWYFKNTCLTAAINRLDFFLFRLLLEKLLFKLSARHISQKRRFNTIVAFQEGAPTRMGACFSQYKITWVHSCYSFAMALSRRQRPLYSEKYYAQYDKIVCVSDFALNDFNSYFPKLAKRTTRIYNSLNIDSIIKKSRECFEGKDGVFTIVSVGRLTPDKQFQLIPKICREILDRGMRKPFRWLIIGSGGSFIEIEREIRRYNVCDNVFLLGAKNNPYPYMKTASLVVVLSISESWSYVLHEGLALGRPVLINRYPGCGEFDKNGAVLSDAISNFPSKISDLLDNTNGLYSSLLCATKEDIFSTQNHEILRKIQEIFLIKN